MANLTKFIISFVLTFVLSFCVFPLDIVSAATYYELDDSVLSDLSKDSTFSTDKYSTISIDDFKKVNSDEDSINDRAVFEVIQIAESENGSLYIYTYEPIEQSLNITASTVFIDREFSSDGTSPYVRRYSLELVSKSGHFSKYRVKGLEVAGLVFNRFYYITQILFSPSEEYKKHFGVDEYTSLVSCSVAQQWCVTIDLGIPKYSMNTFDVLYYEVCYAGYVNVAPDISLGMFVGNSNKVQIWFISVDFPKEQIAYIYEVDFIYDIRRVVETYSFIYTKKEESWTPKFITLSSLEERETITVGDISKRTFSWNSIYQTPSFFTDFIKQNTSFNEESKTKIEASDFTFVFECTESSIITTDNSTVRSFYEIQDINLVRVHYLNIHGDIYNIGAVGDSVIPDDRPAGTSPGVGASGCDNMETIFILIITLVTILLIFKAIQKVLFYKAISKKFLRRKKYEKEKV